MVCGFLMYNKLNNLMIVCENTVYRCILWRCFVNRSLQKKSKNMKKQLITNKNKAKKRKKQPEVAKKRV